jgi:hypothetical protein
VAEGDLAHDVLIPTGIAVNRSAQIFINALAGTRRPTDRHGAFGT